MNKQMLQIKVFTSDGAVFIEQNEGLGGVDIILVMPEQIEMLCAWLEIAKEEIEGEEAERNG